MYNYMSAWNIAEKTTVLEKLFAKKQNVDPGSQRFQALSPPSVSASFADPLINMEVPRYAANSVKAIYRKQ